MGQYRDHREYAPHFSWLTYISTDAIEQSFIDWHNILSWSGSDLMLAWAIKFIILTLFFSQKQSSFVGITPDRILSKKSQLINSFIWKWPSANMNWNKFSVCNKKLLHPLLKVLHLTWKMLQSYLCDESTAIWYDSKVSSVHIF